ncbi:MAG TPA: glycosyltransferase family 39 protein [Candidatus Polarisedimenticolia bacterium]|nr:glycosyltransferase family 39 protein [Candidatus Polarisedimenticolia bacterium]
MPSPETPAIVSSLLSPSRERHRLLVLAVGSLLIFAAGIGMRALWNPNEPVYGEGVREMLVRHDYYLPYVNGAIYSDKPILYFWIMIFSTWIAGGLSEAALRLPSVLSGVLSVVLVYRLGRRVFGIRAGFLAASCLATSVMFWWHSQYIQMDQILSFLILAALSLFFIAHETAAARRGILLAASGAAMGLAFLTKGPVGLLVPAGVMAVFLLLTGDWRRISVKETAWMAVFFVLLAAPWYVSLAFTGHGAVLTDFFIRHNLERATDPFNHARPFWYYLPRLFSDLFPWSLFLPAALFAPSRNELERKGRLFALLWLAVVFLLFSAAGSKRGVYLLPLYPAAALLVGKYWDEILSGDVAGTLRRWARGGLLFLAVFLLLAGVSPFLLALWRGPYRSEALRLLAVGGTALAGAAAIHVFLRRGRIGAALVAVTLTFAGVYLYADLVLLRAADRFKSPVPFCRQVDKWVGKDDEIHSHGLWRWDSSYLFYTGRLMPQIHSLEEVDAYLRQGRPVFLLVESDEMDQFLSGLKVPVRVLVRQDIGHRTTALLTNRRA